jgi:hemoglobin/transferrin/lactoferrin receptor protein
MGLVAKNAAALLSGVAVLVLVGSGAGYAQTATTNAAVKKNAGNVTLLERLVIGAGRPKVAIDTPQAVTVLDQADIDDKQANTIGEIFDATPGITMIGSERAFGESFNIRGIGAAETSGDESRIVLTVDGAKKFYEQYRMGSFFSDPELYKRVEVLRGPASSTLYGAGAFGGVINFTTKDAEDFIKEGKSGALRLKGTYTSNGNGTLGSAILAQRINDTFSILATGNYRRSDAVTLANGGTLTGSEFSSWSGLVKGTARFGDNDEQIIRLSYQRWNSVANKQDYAQTGTIPLNNAQNFGLIDRDVTDQTAVFSYENPASDNPYLDLKGSLSVSKTDVSQKNPTSPFAAPGSFFAADYGYLTYQGNLQNTSEFSGNGWENFLTYGVEASHQIRSAEPANGALITTHPEGTNTKFGIFAQSEHTINDVFTVTAGARGDFSRLSPDSRVIGAADRDQFAFSPKIAALYRLNENLNVFGSVAHTERLPTLDEMFQYSAVTGGFRTPNLNLTKEQSNNFELGLGTQFYDVGGLENSVGLKVTGFYNDIKDGIRSNPFTSAGNPYTVNISNMRIWGVELEGSYESEYLYGRLAYTYTKGEYGQTITAASAAATITAGTPLETIPQDKLVLTVGTRLPEYALDLGAKLTVASKPTTAVATVPATTLPDGWATVDAYVSWKPQDGPLAGTEAMFSVENIFNSDYRENLSMDRSKGRTFKLTLAKQFDY